MAGTNNLAGAGLPRQVVSRWAAFRQRLRHQQRMKRYAKQVGALEGQEKRRIQSIRKSAEPPTAAPPVVFFNASARLGEFSQNAAFALLTSWSLRLASQPVIYFACQAGLSHCVLASGRAIGGGRHTSTGQAVRQPPPCRACLQETQALFAGAEVRWLRPQNSPELRTLAERLVDLSIDELAAFAWPVTVSGQSLFSQPAPLGALTLPSLRWAMRQHTLNEHPDTRYLFRQFILSAYQVVLQFTALVDEVQPAAAVIFNGIMYPEAAACWAARQRGLRVITHEVSFQPFSAFFSAGEATAYPIHIPDSFELSSQQEALLDGYLEKRFQGQFTMAGIRFWPEMRRLEPAFLEKASGFRQIVPIFTNVVYDTSQVHANRVFPHMFAWLDQLLEVIHRHPETLFVIRAHPDEMRPGTAKQSRESVREWVGRNGVDRLDNVVFIDSQEYLSSYELIQRAKFVIVYNSSIGMEAALLGAAVVCGGKARYTQLPMVFFPDTPEAYQEQVEAFLRAEHVQAPPEFRRNARRFLYYQLYRVSLSFDEFLQPGHRQGLVELKDFSLLDLLPENSAVMRTIYDGILQGNEFIYDAFSSTTSHQPD